ncbi:MAG TPA: glycoside hydrolase family 172 protein [Deinococcales bacterium]|nr:glycoside hydrolase family 172 protein [Deinococcales bacterium]
MSLDLGFGFSNLARLGGGVSRSFTAENPDGRPGGGGLAREGSMSRAARDLGPGWKVSPFHRLEPGETFTLMDVSGPGAVRHVWITCAESSWRELILRAFWDDAPEPAVEVPLGDFFCQAWNEFTPVASLPVAVNPRGGLNAYLPMPFARRAVLTVEHRGTQVLDFFYQVDVELGELPPDFAFLHAHFRRSNPLAALATHEMVDVSGRGHYLGTFCAWGAHSDGWWGEGEVKFHLDDDAEGATVCGTGTEDYFGGAWGFEVNGRYQAFTSPFSGFAPTTGPAGAGRAQPRYTLYRWHVPDPIRFSTACRASVQALGWRSGGRFLPLRDDIATTAFLYLDRPGGPRPPLPDRDALEVT